MRRRRSEGSVTKKRGRWYAVLSTLRDDCGRRTRHWSHAFETRRAAEHALAQMLIDGRTAKETSATVESVVREYIRRDTTPRGRRSPTTTNRYNGLFVNMAPIYKKRVDRLDGVTIENFYMSLLERGLSQTTVHHVHNLMFAAFRWAKTKRINLIAHNPLETEDITRPRRAKSNAISLTIEQAQRTLDHLVRTKHANALVFSLATGCRRGETCGLKWSAVDFHRKIAIIREARYQTNREQGQKSTKAEQIREVPLNQTALRALAAERQRQEGRRAFASDAWTETGHVFTDELGLPLSPMALTNAFARCARHAELPTTRMHTLRHTAATFILSAGGNPVAATKILGHSEEATTLKLYGHVIGLDAARAAKQIDRALDGRHLGRRDAETKKKARKNGPDVVAPTGIEPVFPP